MNRIQAMELDGQIRKHLEEYSLQNGLNPAFGNTIMDKYLQIIPDTAKREMIFLGDKSVSYKLGNIRLTKGFGSFNWVYFETSSKDRIEK